MPKFAYVTVLYGNNIYLTGALVLGYSLLKTKTTNDRIIMVTPDVSSEYQKYLSEVFTHVIKIDYVKVNTDIFEDANTRFSNVFTKLECLSLISYDKIILLDLDMIVAQNIDHLFELKAPAACLKRFNIPYGQTIPSNMICDNNKLVGSINAGLMLLKPSLIELEAIKTDISNNQQLNKYKYPEQDYLSLRYCNKWTSITFNYNFQFGLTLRVRQCRYKINEIFVIHYSSSYKPWSDLLPNEKISDNEVRFKLKHRKYYDLWMGVYKSVKRYFANKKINLPF